MNEKLFIQLCEASLATALVAGLFIILKASWYDLRMIHIKKQVHAAISRMTSRRQLAVKVVVYAHDNLSSLQACLESIHASQYKNYTLVVADHGSIDGTSKFLQRYKRLYPTLPLITYRARTATNYSDVVRNALKKDKNSQLILLLNATHEITPSLLHETAARFNADSTLDILRLRSIPASDLSISSLLTYFTSLTENILRKSFTNFLFNFHSKHSQALAVRRSTLEDNGVAQKASTSYASTIVYTQSPNKPLIVGKGRQSDTVLERYWIPYLVGGIVVLILTFTAFTYFAYTAATMQSNTLLTLSWTTVSLWLLAVIWSDGVYKLGKKIELTSAVPFIYFILYAYLGYRICTSVWLLAQDARLPNLTIRHLRESARLELYSTRY